MPLRTREIAGLLTTRPSIDPRPGLLQTTLNNLLANLLATQDNIAYSFSGTRNSGNSLPSVG